mgnify:CR=1 FL=1
MYHHEGKFGDPADPFCTILGKLGIMLKDTDVNQLYDFYDLGSKKLSIPLVLPKSHILCACARKSRQIQMQTITNFLDRPTNIKKGKTS